MANFLQSTPEIPSAGIGDQKIVQGVTASLATGLSQSVAIGADIAGNLSDLAGQRKAEGIVNEAAQQALAVETSFNSLLQQDPQLRAEDIDYQRFITANPELQMTGEEFDTLKRAKDQGNLTGTAVELFAASKAREAMRRNPLLSGSIRRAASNLIGFNVNTAGAKFVIDQLNAQARSVQSRAKTSLDKYLEDGQAMFSLGLVSSVEEGARIMAGKDVADARHKIDQARVQLGELKADTMLANQIENDRSTRYNEIKAVIEQWKQDNPGKTVSKEDIDQLIITQQNAYQSELTDEYTREGLLTTDLSDKITKRVDDIYKPVKDYFSTGDIAAKVERLAKINKNLAVINAANTHTLYFNLANGIGSEFATKVVDLISNSRSTKQFEALMKQYPTLFTVFNGDTNKFKGFALESLSYITDTAGLLGVESTAGEQGTGVIDVEKIRNNLEGNQDNYDSFFDWWNANRDQMPDNVKDSVSSYLQDRGHNLRATSILSTNYRNATREERKYYQQQFKLDKQIAPANIADAIFNSKGYRIELVNNRFAMIRDPNSSVSATESEKATQSVQALNEHLIALERGWSTDVGTNRDAFIRDVQSSVDVRLDELRNNQDAKITKSNNVLASEEFKTRLEQLKTDLANAKPPEGTIFYKSRATAEQKRKMLDEFLNEFPDLQLDRKTLYQRLQAQGTE